MKQKLPVEQRNFHKPFGVLGVLTLIGLLWAGYDDVEVRRPWKDYQRQFFTLQKEILARKVQEAEEALKSPDRREKTKEIESKIAEDEKAIEDWDRENQGKFEELEHLDEKIHDTEMGITFRKSELDAVFYRYQHAKIQGEDTAPREAEMKSIEDRIKGLEAELLDLNAKRTDLARFKQEKLAEVKKLRADLNSMERGAVLARQNLSELRRPTTEIKQVVVNQLGAVDRCQTCHLAIDDATFSEEKIPEPFRTHPHLKDLLGEHHPVESFGCTVCHDGQGAQTKGVGWEKFEHGWDDHYWERPLLKGPFVQSTCLACHQGYADQNFAPVLSKGKALFVEVGCYGCHRMEGIDPFRKQAPKLNEVATKTTRGWIQRWLRNPKAFRPRTRMPSFWPEAIDAGGKDRTGSTELARREEETEALAEFLLSLSTGAGLPDELDPVETDPAKIEKGRRVVESAGCRACHTTGDGDKKKPDGTDVVFGPDLSRVGEKLRKAWLKAWLKDPKSYWNRTLMPSLRLSDDEIEAAATYLLTLRKSNGDEAPAARPPQPDEARKQALVEKGRKLVAFYGCFGCHETAGFEKATPIGIELTEFGEKPTERLDFGEVKLKKSERNWYLWTRMKLHNPRVFKTKRIDLKMPNFSLADDEIDAIMVFLKGMARPKNPEQYRIPAPEKTSAGRGEELTRRFNCRGCHEIGGKGGDVWIYLDDPALRPPVLTGEGKKVQGEWLFRFLRGPSPLRPWLKLRMPTFGLDEEQANDLVNYFVSLAGQKLPYSAEPWKRIDGERAKLGEQVFAKLKCLQCHVVAEGGSLALSDLAPNLSMAAGRLRPEWVTEWILGPQILQPGTKMPDFFPAIDEDEPTERSTPLPDVLGGDVSKQVELIRDYLGNLASHPGAPAHARAPAASAGG